MTYMCFRVIYTLPQITREQTRKNASHNAFVRECCQQTIDQLTAERRAIEAEFVG